MVIGNILQAHLRAAAELQEKQDQARIKEHQAAHEARLQVAKAKASAERDERFAQRLKDEEDAEEKREMEELNGGNKNGRGTRARERSRTPPVDRDDEKAPPPPPPQPVAGSATNVPIAVLVKAKLSKGQKKAATQTKKA